VIAAALCAFAFLGFDYSSQILSLQYIETTVANLGINAHYLSISRGVLDTRDLIYFITFASLFLLGTKMIMGGKR
jgi:ABC-2 type transport system permease protein